MRKTYAKQVDPTFQEDYLFYQYKDIRTGKYVIGLNDEIYGENIIIDGNRDFMSYFPADLENIRKDIENFVSDNEPYCGYRSESTTTLVKWYFKKQHHSKKWSKFEIHKWKQVCELMNDWTRDNEETALLIALKLITGKEWKSICFKGCSQSDYQYAYVSESLTQSDISYIEACYFNTGTEWRVYESYKDFKNNENDYSVYITGYTKQDLAEALNCKEKHLVAYEFNGYDKTEKYVLMGV